MIKEYSIIKTLEITEQTVYNVRLLVYVISMIRQLEIMSSTRRKRFTVAILSAVQQQCWAQPQHPVCCSANQLRAGFRIQLSSADAAIQQALYLPDIGVVTPRIKLTSSSRDRRHDSRDVTVVIAATAAAGDAGADGGMEWGVGNTKQTIKAGVGTATNDDELSTGPQSVMERRQYRLPVAIDPTTVGMKWNRTKQDCQLRPDALQQTVGPSRPAHQTASILVDA